MITFKQVNNYLLAEVTGEIVLANSTAIKNELKEQIGPNDRQVILDLSKVTFIDSAGVGVLISLLKSLNGGVLVAIVTDPVVLRVLEITRIDRLIPLVPSLAEAEAALG